MGCYYLVGPDTMAWFSYDDVIEPEEEWEAPGLLLELVLAGCPVTDIGSSESDEVIELRLDEDRVFVMTGHGSRAMLEINKPVRALLLPWIR